MHINKLKEQIENSNINVYNLISSKNKSPDKKQLEKCLSNYDNN